MLLISLIIFNNNPLNKTQNISNYVIDGDIAYLNTALNVKYVGRKVCGDCHTKIYETFIHSTKGRSMYRMTNSNIIENFPQKKPVYNPERNYFYEMIRKNNKFYQREYRLDKKGKIIFERFEEAQYIIGSGKNLRMYFFKDKGMYYQLPLTWYVHKNKWDMSPGYSEFKNIRFSRFVSPLCFSCHNGHLTLSKTAKNRYKDDIHLGIGCESCHGPGELHVRQKKGEKLNINIKNAVTIVNPKKLSPYRRIDVCEQCHLEGESWALRGNNTWFDFRPGMLLKSHRSVYSTADISKKAFKVANTAYRLSLSRCFKGSHIAMTCDLCHDPHGFKKSTNDYNRQNCQKCHPPQSLPGKKSKFTHSENDNCISCHMKKTGTKNTLHGVINTDHWIRIAAEKDTINWEPLKRISKTDPIKKLIPIIDTNDKNKDIRKGIAYFNFWTDRSIIKAYLDSSYFYLKSGLVKSKENSKGYYYLGKVQYYRGLYKEALYDFNKSISLDTNYADAYFQRGQVYNLMNKHRLAIVNFSKATKILPDEPSYFESLGMSYAKVGLTNKAISILEVALTKDNQNPSVFYTLGTLYATDRKIPKKAIPYFEKAVGLNPEISNGFLNLGNSYFLIGNFNKAINAYKKDNLISKKPSNSLVNMGIAYERLGEYKKARKSFEEALKLSPGLRIAEKNLRALPNN